MKHGNIKASWRMGVIGLGILLTGAACAVEGYMLEEQTQTSVLGKPSSTVTRTYSSTLGIRVENKDSVTLIAISNDKTNKNQIAFYQLDPAHKTYMHHANSTVMLMLYFSALAECDAKTCHLKPDLFTDLKQKELINGYMTQKMRIQPGGLITGASAEAWCTKDWKLLNEAVRSRWLLTAAALESSGNALGLDLVSLRRVIDELLASYGTAIKTVTVFSKQLSGVTTVTQVTKTNLEDAMFSVPIDYKEKPSFWPAGPTMPARP
jgi:hypothetical protein